MNALNILASTGCKQDVVHLGRKINFMFVGCFEVFQGGKVHDQERG